MDARDRLGLAEGFGSSVIRDAVAGRSADELLGLLEGNVRVVLAPQGTEKPSHEKPSKPFPQVAPASSNAARARAALLRDVRAKAGLAAEEIAPPSPMASGDVPVHLKLDDAAPEDASADAGAHLDADDDRFHASLASIFRPSDWTRIRIVEGLELHVRDDYRLPRNRAGDDDLLRLLKTVLLDLEQRSKGKP
ncbi:MAG: hypothetical protein R6W77_07005 [Trueperaceae bacterium]